MKQKLTAILTLVCFLFTLVPAAAFAETTNAATIVENGSGASRYAETEAEVSFYPTSYDSQLDWQYYYIVSQQDAEKTVDEVISGGTAHEFDENGGVATFDVTDLAEGVKYVHIVLVQKNDTTQVSNVLKLTIPEYVPLTIVPSAEGCELDSNNTLTVAVGTTVTFTTSESGCGMDYKEDSKVGPELEFVGDEGYIRTATFSEIGTYTIEASINYKTAECTVIVVEELHQHSYSSEWIMDDVGHWHACECGDMTEYADHEYEGQDCEDGEKHRLICRYCGFQYRTGNLTSVFDHEYDNDCDSSCNGCGYERTVAPHSGTSCDICGWTFAQSVPTGLRWDTSNGTVAVWDAVDGATSYIVELWKKDIISLHLLSHVVSDTSFEYYLTTLSPGSYYFTVRATCDDIKSKSATSNDIIMTTGGTPILINGSSESVDYIDGTAFIVGREDIVDGSVSEVDLSGASGSTNLVIDQSKIDPNADKVTVKFDGTQAEMNNDALRKILDNLDDGDNVKISVKNAGSEVLPNSLTEKEPFEDDDGITHYSVFTTEGIFTYDELSGFGVFGGTDESISWGDMKLLYHYMTTEDLEKLYNRFSGGSEDLVPFVDWLNEMIERDATVVNLNTGHLDESGILSKLEEVGYTGGGFTLGLLRQADLDMKQLEYVIDAMEEIIEEVRDSGDENLILAWANEAIAQKEFEATCAQMNALLEEARNTQGSYTGLNDVKAAVKKMTTYELKLFLKKANAAKNTESGTIPVLALGAIDSIIKVLNSELEARGTNDVPTYVQVDGTNDGINPIFIGAVDVNISAVKADGTTTPIAIKADRSDAVAWSTNIGSAALEEMLVMLGATTTEDVVSNIKAYKVLDNGTLEARGVKVVQNADGSLTLKALSDGNSIYIFTYEPTVTTSSSSSGGGFIGVYNYPVTVSPDDNGSAILSDSNAVAGESVTITTKPNSGYGAADVIVTDEDGNVIPVTDLGNGQYAFTMPEGEVNVEAVYKPAITMVIDSVYINVFGKIIKNDVAPVIVGDRTMLPIRVVAEALGADVDWDAELQKVTITKGDTMIELFIGETTAYVNGKAIQLDVAPFIDNDRTYLPVRFVSEYLGAVVHWDADTRTVTVIPE